MPESAPKNRGAMRFIQAGIYSWQGVKAAYRNEEAFRQELMLAIVLTAVSFAFDVTALERALMIASLLLVMLVELLNSAIEAVVDRIGPERHELSGRAKDISSAAVTMAMAIVVLLWGTILLS
ncbi:diacylglycerol kinase [Ferrimonas senticii]|uniref:diacylglycerol kinase n=1 Tax=Ferrimonas senticii TaxID=394566 RepID=UPI0004096D69|nr:diacylglycerol kinase [Ferrimonas senticii]